MKLAVSAFQQRVHARSIRDRQPTSCLFEITPVCNLRCRFCYVALDPYAGPYLSTAQSVRVLDALAEAGILWLTFTGGEIFSRRDFATLYRHARAKGFLVTLFTNATLVTEDVASLLAEHPPHAVEVSIYGADAAHYEGTTGIPGSFARFERGVDRLRGAGVNLILKHPTSTLTEDHVPAIQAWCESRRLPYKLSFEIENRHDGGQQPSVYRIEPRRARSLERQVRGPTAGPLPECGDAVPGREDGRESLYRCSAGRTNVFIDALGNASHCVLDREPAFSLLEMSFADAWRRIGEWVEQPLPEDAPCAGCGLRSGCSNCPARARLATGNPFGRDSYRCDLTHAAHGLPYADHAEAPHARPLGACAR
jgi:radical SAM protein with 4Fe4S-binding SPASM domain